MTALSGVDAASSIAAVSSIASGSASPPPQAANANTLANAIIFFISMPVTLGLSFAGLAAYKLAAGTWGSFDKTEYAYLAVSTVSLSFSVALHDNRVVYKKRGT